MLSGVFNNFELARSSVTESSGGRIHIEKIENYFAGGGDSMGREKEKSRRPPSPWQSGSFYLVSLVLLILLAAGTSKWLGWWALPLVIIGATVGVTTVGALQLRQDQRLSEHSFLKLMALAFRQLPLLKQVLPGNDRAPKMEIKG
jgi:hypothetical protein